MESLSEYMLLEVFTRLDPASLKNCTEVCKKWNDLISESASTMSKLTLNVNASSKLRDFRDFNRRYFNMKLFRMTIGPKTWSLLLNYQPNLHKLEINQFTTTESDFVKKLQSVSTLQELKIIDCSLRSRNERSSATVQMPLLKKLTISHSAGFLENINGSELKKLELNGITIAETDYVNLLRSASALQDLTVINCYLRPKNDSQKTEVEVVQMPMLQKLTIHYSSVFLRNIDGSELKKLVCFCDHRLPCGFISSLEKLEDLFLNSYNEVVDSFASAKIQLKELEINLPRDSSSICTFIKAHTSTLETLKIKTSFHREATDYDLTNVAPYNSLSTQSLDDFYPRLISFNSLRDSPELIASTAKYYFPQLKFMKIYRPRSV